MDAAAELAEAVETSRQAEVEGWLLYMAAARSTDRPEVRRTFLDLAREEEHHLQRIEALARGRFRLTGPRSRPRGAVAGLLRERAAAYRRRARRARSDAEALDLAIEIEDRAHVAYRRLAAGSSQTRVRAFFERLSAEEHDHGKVLRTVRTSLGAV